MNSKERIYAVLNGETPDRIPNSSILMTYIAGETGVKYRDFCLDPATMVEGNIICAEKYGLDLVTTMSDPMTEAHDLGTDVIFPEDDVPYSKTVLLGDKSALASLKPVKPEDGYRMSKRIETVRLFKEKTCGEFPVVGWVEGCFAESADLRGVNDFLMDCFDRDAFFTDLLDLCLEQAVMFAKAQYEAGADIIGVGDAIASVAGPAVYEQSALEYERKLLGEIKKTGAKTKLHICGNIQPFLHLMPFEYIDILDVDWMVSLEKVRETVPEHVTVSGNYNPVGVVQYMDRNDVMNEVRSCAEVFRGRKYLTAAGCEIPRATPPENLMCINEALAGIVW